MKTPLPAFLPLFVVVALSQTALPQTPVRARTETGRDVILSPDGTWKYVEESKTSTPAIGNYTKPQSAKTLFKPKRGSFGVWYDESKWRVSQPDSSDTIKTQFNLVDGDGYALVIAEGLPIPITALKRIALENAKNAVPDTRLIAEETRVVNGREVILLKFEGTTQEIMFRYLGYYYGGKQGNIQVLTYTAQSLFEKYEKDFIDFVNGLEVYE